MPGGAHENMRGWSPEEDELLLQLIETSGKRWKLIAEALGNANPRTPAMVRNRYLRIERGRWLTEQGMSKNRCGQCGQLKRGHVCQAPRSNAASETDEQSKEQSDARTTIHGVVSTACGSVPSSPLTADNYPTPGKLALGAPPLTYVGLSESDEAIQFSLGMSPDMGGIILNGTPGQTPHSLAGIMGTAVSNGPNPPALRPQSSFDMLLRASEMRSTEQAPEQPKILADTPSVVPGDFPFRSVASENPEPVIQSPASLTSVTSGLCGASASAILSANRAEYFAPNTSQRASALVGAETVSVEG